MAHSPRQIGDIVTALSLLSRLPLAGDGARMPAAAWAFPVAGIVIAGCAAIPGLIAQGIGLSAPAIAALVLAAQIVVTGALHEDGLADCADGFWGGWDKARRLEIMKDSHIGTYGVLALGLSLLARWSALIALINVGGWVWTLIAVAALSRAPLPMIMARVANARGSGLSQMTGAPDLQTAWIAAGIGGATALVLGGLTGLVAICAVAVIVWLWTRVALAKIGGQTGDVLGAAQQLAEITALLVFSAAL